VVLEIAELPAFLMNFSHQKFWKLINDIPQDDLAFPNTQQLIHCD
jgi:hypothetical protein